MSTPFSGRRAWPVAAIACAIAFAVACGSASMGGGIAGTSTVVGTITDFGSIFVGGVEFDTAGAAIVIDGERGTEADLKLGMVATVRGVVEVGGRRGSAERVLVDPLVTGPIQTIDDASSRIRALDQEIALAPATVFDPVPLAALRPDDTIVVDGFRDATGIVHATRISASDPSVGIDVRGLVTALDVTDQTLRIGDLTLEFADALIVGAPPGGLANGLLVEVDLDEAPSDGVGIAVEIAVIDPTLGFEPGDGLDLEGFVTAIRSPAEFVLSGTQVVRTTSNTRFRGGSASDIAVDVALEAEGVADTEGVLVATEIEFRR